MKILNPNDVNHTIKLIPRFYPNGICKFQLKNEYDKEFTNIDINPINDNGILIFNFITKPFENNSFYQIKITNNSEIMYRGKLFVTTQSDDLQNFKLTKDIYQL
jgi:hypothetical protein